MAQFSPAAISPRATYRLLTSLIVPRPIAWVSTLAADGARNLAPHSYFNVISSYPPILHFTSTGEKDSLRNCRATGEFVVNIVTRDLVEQMNTTAADFPPDEDEFSWAALEAAPSTTVKPPRVAATKAAFECHVEDIISKGNGHMVFGEVLHVHVADELLVDGVVDPHRLPAVGRLGGPNYADTSSVFSIPRPTWADLR